MQNDEDFKVTVGAVLTGIWRELKKANQLKAHELMMLAKRDLTSESAREYFKMLDGIIHNDNQR